MSKTLAFSLTVVMLLLTTAGFASLYFNQAAEIEALRQDMKSLQETATVTTDINVSSSGMAADTAGHVAMATVRLDITGTNFVAVGSGFIISKNGYVLTNEHVVADAREISATLGNGETFKGRVLDSDQWRDLALVRLDTERTDLPEISIATDREVSIGTSVVAVGYPLGLELGGPPSFTAGIVSAKRNINGLDYVQTDAALNSGNSGGPLVNYQGFVVGVCTGAVVDSGTASTSIGLAIPVPDFLKFMADSRARCGDCHA
jgi:serine protease Do